MVKNRFNIEKAKHPELGDYINLCSVVKGKFYHPDLIRKSFNELVSRDEYDRSERKDYIDYLIKVTQMKNE